MKRLKKVNKGSLRFRIPFRIMMISAVIMAPVTAISNILGKMILILIISSAWWTLYEIRHAAGVTYKQLFKDKKTRMFHITGHCLLVVATISTIIQVIKAILSY